MVKIIWEDHNKKIYQEVTIPKRDINKTMDKYREALPAGHCMRVVKIK